MKRTLKECVRFLIYIIYRLLPKFNYAIVYGWPDYEDSALILEERLSVTSVRKVIFFIEGKINNQFHLRPKTKIVRKVSVRGWLYFLFAKYIFFTHQCFMRRFPPNVISVNVWHGIPIKKVGWMDGNRGIASHYTLATSEFSSDIMQKVMTAFNRTLITGLPRNDRLFSDATTVGSRLKPFQISSFKKTIIWLPTYRRSVRGEIRHDGKDYGNVYGMPGMTAESLNDFLKQQNAFAFVKPHPLAPFEKTVELSNLAVVDDQWLCSRGITLYALLGQTDILITDISSVVIDYLILDRPVIHSFPDLAEYESSKGFLMNPVTDYLAGPMVANVAELTNCLTQVLQGEDSHAEQRRRMRELFHKNPDADSTSRLLQHLKLLPK